MLTILYFAWVRERIGAGAETVEPPAALVDVGSLIAWLAGRSEGHRAALDEPKRLRAAIDGTFVSLDAPIAGAVEVAIFPPVTGG